MLPEQTSLAAVKTFLGEVFGCNLHAKRILSLSGATLGAIKTCSLAQESPHFAFVFSQMTPNMAVKTGCSRSLAAKRSSSGSSLCSGMVGMS